MGASFWDCLEEYTEDVHVAFARAQRRVLEEGDYYSPLAEQGSDAERWRASVRGALQELENTLVALGDEDLDEMFVQERRGLRLALGMGEDTTRDDWQRRLAQVRAQSGEAGTHSILDIERVDTDARPPAPRTPAPHGSSGMLILASEPPPPAIRLLTPQEIEAFYETPKPTLDLVEGGGIADDVPRWSGVAHLVYDAGGNPTHWYFAGVSGD